MKCPQLLILLAIFCGKFHLVNIWYVLISIAHILILAFPLQEPNQNPLVLKLVSAIINEFSLLAHQVYCKSELIDIDYLCSKYSNYLYQIVS